MTFNPNEIGIPNGNFFGFPYSVEESEIVLISVPWDVTTSYGKGTASGPEAIIDASLQIDLFDFDVENAWKIKVGTIPIPEEMVEKNIKMNEISSEIIEMLEEGTQITDNNVAPKLDIVNMASNETNNWVYEKAKEQLSNNKIIGIIGGEHSVPYGAIKAIGEKYNDFGILHIDAHADLRKAYEGFEHSHASIMNNSLAFQSISKLVQVAIRDVCEDEIEFSKKDSRIVMFNDSKIKEKQFNNQSWNSICDEIIIQLPEKVYISFDIDGLTPELCPNTGTPVPGGLTFNEATFLLKKLIEHKKQIIGFDLCEVSPGETEWDANVGARILQKLINYTHKSNL